MVHYSDDQIKSVLKLQGCLPETPEVGLDLERRLGVTFPSNLKRIWAMGEESAIYFSGFSERPYCSALCSLKTHHFEFCSSTIDERIGLICDDFPGVIPIGKGGDGSMLVLDYRRSTSPVVLVYDLDITYRSRNPFYFMARNVDEMIDRGLIDRQQHYAEADQLLTVAIVSDIIGFPANDSFDRREQTKERPSDYFIR